MISFNEEKISVKSHQPESTINWQFGFTKKNVPNFPSNHIIIRFDNFTFSFFSFGNLLNKPGRIFRQIASSCNLTDFLRPMLSVTIYMRYKIIYKLQAVYKSYRIEESSFQKFLPGFFCRFCLHPMQ